MGSSVGKHFSRSAGYYGEEDIEQRLLRACLCLNLSACLRPERILDIGCGTGSLSAQLAQRWPSSHIDAVDVAQGMIDFARTRYGGHRNIYWHAVDFRRAALAGRYQLVVSNAAFHWMNPLEEVFNRVHTLLDRGGTLLCSVFLDGTMKELLEARQRVASQRPAVVQLPSASQVLRALESCGLELVSAQLRAACHTFASVDAVLRHVKLTGVSGSTQESRSQRLSLAEMKALKAIYPEHAGVENGVGLSFKSIIIVARRT